MFEIVSKVSLNGSTDKMTVKAPLVAAKALPGQFVIIRADEYAERIPALYIKLRISLPDSKVERRETS